MSPRPPNTRVHRTRSSPSAPHLPLTRYPLGRRRFLVACLTMLLIARGAAMGVTPTPTPSVSVGRPVAIRPTTAVNVASAVHFDFPKGPSAVVISYETKIDIADFAAFAAQADELMKFWQGDVEADGVTSAVLRASHDGKGYGFLYERQSNGAWVRKAQ